MKTGGIRSVAQLAERGLADDADAIARVCETFSLAITDEMAGLIEGNAASDPIARQFVPTADELSVSEAELADPIGDDRFSPVKGIVHRYPDRVLLKPVHVCPVYCRFCFRREKVGEGGDGNLSKAELDAALAYIREHAAIWEVILTGGDPLILSARKIGAIVAALDQIPHVKVIRIHTRVPVVAPSRIDKALIAALSISKPVYVVLHVNHARELAKNARAAIARLALAGIPLLSQSVLLRGVNDSEAALTDLFRALIENRVKPYYLHHGDLARGTRHFRTTLAEGQKLMRALRGRVSGLCQPQYVLDIPGGAGKVPVGPGYVTLSADGALVEDGEGYLHTYSDL